jgi:hypothetical protein
LSFTHPLVASPSIYPLPHIPHNITVVSEKYDEVVFTNPKATFHQCLLNGHLKNNKKLPYPLSNEPLVTEHFRTYGDEAEVKVMLEAKRFLEEELRNVKDRLLRVDAELEEVKHELSAAKELEGGMPGGVAGSVGGSGGGGAPTAATGVSTSSAMGNNKPGTVRSANTAVVVAGSKGNRGGKTLKKKAPPPPPPSSTTTIATTSSASAVTVAAAAMESQQPTGKKMKAS